MKSVSLKEFAEALDLQQSNGAELNYELNTSEINRIGLQLVGFYDHFPNSRIQIMGRSEWSYFEQLSDEVKAKRAEQFMSQDIPGLLITRGLDVFPELSEAAKKYERPILVSEESTTRFINRSTEYLEDMLAPTITVHGVLVDVYGIGVLILGKSGVGKSETALELIKRGHRFVADDAIEIKKKRDGNLLGTAPELIKNFIEIRGIGILNIAKLYGIGSVREDKQIDLVVQFELWDDNAVYDRLGLDDQYTEILDTKIAKIKIPVKPGRNLAVILEVAARNHRQKQMGYNAAQELDQRLTLNNSLGEL